MNFVASLADRRVGGSEADRMTRKRTTRSGTEREVTNSGMACILVFWPGGDICMVVFK